MHISVFSSAVPNKRQTARALPALPGSPPIMGRGGNDSPPSRAHCIFGRNGGDVKRGGGGQEGERALSPESPSNECSSYLPPSTASFSRAAGRRVNRQSNRPGWRCRGKGVQRAEAVARPRVLERATYVGGSEPRRLTGTSRLPVRLKCN